MPREKAGKYIECELEGCRKKKYYTPFQLKRNNHFFCCREHSSKGRKKGKYIKCQREGCSEESYYSVSMLKRADTYYCSHKCRGLDIATVFDLICANPSCENPEFTRVLSEYRPEADKHYCSHECHMEYQKALKPVVICKNCGEEFQRKPIKIKRASKHFCSTDCRDEWDYTKIYPHTWTLRQKIKKRQNARKHRKALSKGYIANLLNISKDELNDELYTLKKLQLTLHRNTKIKRGIKYGS